MPRLLELLVIWPAANVASLGQKMRANNRAKFFSISLGYFFDNLQEQVVVIFSA